MSELPTRLSPFLCGILLVRSVRFERETFSCAALLCSLLRVPIFYRLLNLKMFRSFFLLLWSCDASFWNKSADAQIVSLSHLALPRLVPYTFVFLFLYIYILFSRLLDIGFFRFRDVYLRACEGWVPRLNLLNLRPGGL